MDRLSDKKFKEEVSIETDPSGRVSRISYQLLGKSVDPKKDLEWVPDEYTVGRLAFGVKNGRCMPQELVDAQVGVVWSIPVCVDLVNAGMYSLNDTQNPQTAKLGPFSKACSASETNDFSAEKDSLKKLADILGKHDIRARDGKNSKYADILMETKRWDMPPRGAAFVPLVCIRAKQIFYGCAKFAPETLVANGGEAKHEGESKEAGAIH